MVADAALVRLLRELDARDYDFVTPTPATHRAWLCRRGETAAASLRDVFGWSLPFRADLLEPGLMALLEQGDALARDENVLRCRYRVSRVGGRLFLHSAYPTDAENAVFLGPDTYRFVRFLEQEAAGPVRRLIDLGTGAGAGGICAASLLPNASILLADSNPEAIRLARINAEAAGIEVETLVSDGLFGVEGAFDLVIANPPFIADSAGRAYRDGGGLLGAAISLDWSLAAAARLAPGGRMLLYTGSAIVDGEDALRAALEEKLPALGCALRYAEIDPDIFGGQLGAPAYRGVERIAAIGAVIGRLDRSDR